MCRRVCIFITVISLCAFIALGAVANWARNGTHQPPVRADGIAHWSVGLDGLHRAKCDAWPFAGVSKNDAVARDENRRVILENDWIEAFSFTQTFYMDRDSDQPRQPGDRVAVIEARTISIPFIPWLATFGVLSCAWPLHGTICRVITKLFKAIAEMRAGRSTPPARSSAAADARIV